jgi:cytochrome oxidase Cu insertion factor (SCO1/SenC/PrrC family)
MPSTMQNDDRARAMRRIQLVGAVIALGALAVLAAIYAAGNQGASKRDAAGHYRFAVGTPGRGQRAPGFTLASSSGGSFSLGAQRGKSVLLYFQEGLTCEPCWTQLKDLERNTSQLRSLGVQQLVSITTDPADQIHQKVQDEGIRSAVLADAALLADLRRSLNGGV